MNNKSLTSNITTPINLEQLNQLNSIIKDLSDNQLLWVSGYLWGVVNQNINKKTNIIIQQEISTITILSASQTGNARKISEWLYKELQLNTFNVNLINAGNYKFKKINQEKILLLIISTQGAGEPPEEAAALYKFLMSKRAPKMNSTYFAVFGLGDSSYEFFSQAGKDFDHRFAILGAKRLIDRVDADIDYEDKIKIWFNLLKKNLKNKIKNNCLDQKKENLINQQKIHINNYNRKNPFNAFCLLNQKITGRNSDKDVRHIEIDINNSKMVYHPGDSIGIWYENDDNLITEILNFICLKGEETVKVNDNIISIKEALKNHYDLTKNSSKIVERYAILTHDKNLLSIIHDRHKLHKYVSNYPIVDMMRLTPVKLTAEQLTKILRPLTPRLYSIASAQSEVENEIHITVNIVNFKIDDYIRGGGASTWLSNRIEEDNMRVFIESNNNFRLPLDKTVPIIMICTGTGIAPFRAFMQQRAYDNASGKNWLFFGNPRFTEDFLYQIEWQEYVKKGFLNKINLAWSRDQSEKIYIQDKIRINGMDIWYWIKEGAYIYVCGNANNMAKDVEKVLLELIVNYGKMSIEKAEHFLSELRIQHRYQRDIY
ncbi:sulfite reductase subunit alpha [Candidatus Pantoea edessiphila]|uniref:Sulfite reductase [NADPH] flavoprotein alpha-component n=1 Tax=Candidatus Pantoea edessiphila TaxID=2044610 RepID=A0A2P5SZN4_9GAMM|nr:NADPH-dependent assimilatory sulfite reductase flavoprotein subunit [Candidatus Pantoea edessiphila]PPI87799.1 sulfite reductase subunit alpha [Candidatus Pantoea edessiphila]